MYYLSTVRHWVPHLNFSELPSPLSNEFTTIYLHKTKVKLFDWSYSLKIIKDYKNVSYLYSEWILSHLKACFKGDTWWELPGGPVVKTQQLSLLWPGVRSLVWELRSHKLCMHSKKRKERLHSVILYLIILMWKFSHRNWFPYLWI